MGSLTVALWVTLAGGLGAVLRFVLAQWIGQLPWGILFANTAASFILGLFINGDLATTVIVSALAGGLSTFSSFAAQTSAFWSLNQRVQAILNFVANLVLPSTGVIVGAALATTLLK